MSAGEETGRESRPSFPAGRVLFIVPQPFFQWRGSPIRVSFNVRALAELGFAVDLLAFPFGEDVPLPDGVTLHRVPNLFGIRTIPIGPSAWKAVYDLMLFFHALVLILRRRHDYIHAVEDAGVIAGVLKPFARIGVIFEKHSDPASYKKGAMRNAIMSIYDGMETFSIRRADAVIGTGPGLIEQIKRKVPGKNAHHIFDIPSSLREADTDKVRVLHQRLCEDRPVKLVMYVGSFAVYQGIDLMFDAIPLALEKAQDIRFVIIGGSPDEIAARKAWLVEKGAADAVEFVGRVPPDELPNWLQAADILLSPRTQGTNTPLKMLDYMKAGRAIVAVDSNANRGIINAETARLTDPTPEEFAEGMVALLHDDNARETLGRAARRMIDEQFNFAVFRQRLKQCYASVS